MSFGKIVFKTSSEKSPILNIEDISTLGYTGLQYRLELPEDNCMLFDMEVEDYHFFWMRNTSIPLDLIFVSAEEKVVGIIKNTEPHSEKALFINKPSMYVIEVNSGWCEKNNIIKGTTIKFQSVI